MSRPLRATVLVGALAASGCAPFGELDLIAVDHPQATVLEAEARVRSVVLHGCDGDADHTVPVGGWLDLLGPWPLLAPPQLWCGFELVIPDDPEVGAVHLRLATDAGEVGLALDPGRVVSELDVDVYPGTDTVIALDLGQLIGGRIDEVTARAGEDVGPGEPLTDDLGLAVPEALWVGTPDDGVRVYLGMWPDVDVHIETSREAGGCHGGEDVGPGVRHTGTPPVPSDTIPPDTDEASPHTDPPTDLDLPGGQADCGGCSGVHDGLGCGGVCDAFQSGCGCDGGFSCSTPGQMLGPWALIGVVAWRRRRGGPRPTPP